MPAATLLGPGLVVNSFVLQLLHPRSEVILVLSDLIYITTRFGPNIPAADMEGNGELDFSGFFEPFLRIFGDFFGELGLHWDKYGIRFRIKLRFR